MRHLCLPVVLHKVFVGLSITLLFTSYTSAATKFRVLHSFKCDPGGCGPNGGVPLDSAGNLYGTTPGGGDTDATIFKLTPSSGGHWGYSLLHTLAPSEGSSLVASVILDSAGNLYGTSEDGGAHNFGTAFELTPTLTAEGWTLHVLYSFYLDGHDGADPFAGVILDQAGNVYGTTRDGGPSGGGIVFELTPGSGGDWTEDILIRLSF